MALLQVKFFSNVLGKCVSMEVCLPQTTNGQIGMEGKAETTFPTLYLLHGMSDDETIWERRTSIERYATAKGIAVVMPTTELGWYTDMECGYQKYYTFVAKELPAVCRGFFRGMSDKREDTWIAGLSMGGYGALKIALNESETFGKAAGLSGAYDICKYPETPYWQSIFGEGDVRVKHTIRTAIEKLIAENRPKPDLYICCGTEDGLLSASRDTKALLEENGFDVTYSESSGCHSWEFWDREIQPILKWMTE